MKRRLLPGRYSGISLVLMGVIVLGGAVAARAGWWSGDDYVPSQELQSIEDVRVDPDSLRIIDTVETGSGAIWEFIKYESSAGTCLDAVGRTAAGDRVMLGGCGDVAVSALTVTQSWNVGSVVLDGSRHELAFGLASIDSSHVRLILEDGSIEVVPVASSGFWIFDAIVPPKDGLKVIRIEAIDARGFVLEQVEVPTVLPATSGSEPHSHEGHSH